MGCGGCVTGYSAPVVGTVGHEDLGARVDGGVPERLDGARLTKVRIVPKPVDAARGVDVLCAADLVEPVDEPFTSSFYLRSS